MNPSPDLPAGVDEIDGLVARAQQALLDYESLTQEDVDRIVKKASVAALNQHGQLALAAVNETGRGVFEDKATKNIFACEHVAHSMKYTKTVGIISRDDLTGITEIAEPVGVVCAITPTTNPTSTAIFKALLALKTRNPIVFAFHPSAQNCSRQAAEIVRDAAVAAGAPENCVQWVENPSIAATGALMNHPGVALILATGGNAMVKAAYSCGKPALGVGAGNVPAYIEKSAKLERAVNDIVLSKNFDNGMVCASEQAAIIDAEIYDAALEQFKRLHAHLCSPEEKAKLEEFIFGAMANSENCAGAKLNSNVVGKSPFWIAQNAGFVVPEDTSILLAEIPGGVGPNEPLTREKLCTGARRAQGQLARRGPRHGRRDARVQRSRPLGRHPHRGQGTHRGVREALQAPSASSRTRRPPSAASVTSTTRSSPRSPWAAAPTAGTRCPTTSRR